MDAIQNQILGCIQISGEDRNIQPQNEFSEVGLPGVENVPTPRGIILRAFPASPRPKRAKTNFLRGFWGAGLATYRGPYSSHDSTKAWKPRGTPKLAPSDR